MRTGFTLISRGGLTFLAHDPACAASPVRVRFSTRAGGRSRGAWSSLNVDPEGGDPRRTVAANQRKVLKALGLRGVFLPRQVHGTGIIVAAEEAAGFAWGEDADAVATAAPGVAVGVMTADCLPVMLYHRRIPAVAAVHAGWRGIAGGIIPAAVGLMAERWGADAAGMCACLGPNIEPCCYEVDEEVAGRIARAAGEAAVHRRAGARPRVDLVLAGAMQLAAAGVPAGNITAARLCTSCNERLFYSYRRDGGVTGRTAAVIVIGG